MIMKDWVFQAPTRPMATILNPVRWYHHVIVWAAVFIILCGESLGDMLASLW